MDFSYLIGNKYRAKLGTNPPKPWDKQCIRMRRELQKEMDNLTLPPLKRRTVSKVDSHIRYFDALMEVLGEEKKPTPDCGVMVVVQMSLDSYSPRYISETITALKRHPNITMCTEEFTYHTKIRHALANMRKNILTVEDSCIPVTRKMLDEFCNIAD